MTLALVVRNVQRAAGCAPALLYVAVGLWMPQPALGDRGQTEPAAVEDILPLANDPDDPIGLPSDTAQQLGPGAERAPAPATPAHSDDRARFGPEPPAFAAKSGEALTAVQSVRELAHAVTIELEAGLSLVATELTFDNASDRPAEVEYRLPVPDDAALAGLEVCNASGCRSGLPSARGELDPAYDDALRARGPRKASDPLPLAQARPLRDARGSALRLRAAPVQRGRPLTVRVRYVSAAPVHGGVARVRLPARGMDPRAAALDLSVSSSELSDVHVGGIAGSRASRIDPWQTVEISARQPSGKSTRSAWQFECGTGRRCAREYLAAAPLSAAPVDLVLAVDASPSTEGVARSRLVPALAAILARAPAGSRVRALRFAARAEPLFAERKDPAQLPLSLLSPVTFEAELGSATRFEAAWELIRSWSASAGPSKARRLIVIVGDGGITRGKARPFEAAERAGWEVSVVNVADRACQPGLRSSALRSGGVAIDGGLEADEAARSGAAERLEERLAALFAPVAIERPRLGAAAAPALRAGESASFEGPARGAAPRSSSVPSRFGSGLRVRGARAAGLQDPYQTLLAVDARDLGLPAREPKPAPEAETDASVAAATPSHPAARSGGAAPIQRVVAKNAALPSAASASSPAKAAPAKAASVTTAPAKAALGHCDARGPALRQGGLSSDERPVALAAERSCTAETPLAAKPQEADSAMPSSPLLGMLRQRIMPVARGCFRRDRAGRPDYQVRAVFEFELAEREVVAAEVTGKITEELRTCLLAAVDQLAVPRFSGRVRVRYPLVTEREPLPSQIELTPHTAEHVDALIAQPDSTP